MGTKNQKAFGILCPHCNSERTGIVDTIPVGGIIKRRRRCGNCDRNFPTFETTQQLLDEPKIKDLLDRLDTAERAVAEARRGVADCMPARGPLGQGSMAPYMDGRVQWLRK